jgi:enoyl-CoA hydratase/carnithine racemase
MDVEPTNPLNGELIDGLTAAIDEFETIDAKVLVISSAKPKIFAAGADIKLMAGLDAAGMARYIDDVREPLWRLASGRKVSIAAIDGHCVGGGLELALACSLRFAAATAKLGLPEVKHGLVPGAGGTQRLPRLIGRGRALELTLSGRSLSGVDAATIGLVDRVVDAGVVEFALDYAVQLARYPSSALASLLVCADAADGPLDHGHEVEKREIVRMISEGEGREGLNAFIQKREPLFR